MFAFIMPAVFASTTSLSVDVHPNPMRVSEFADVTIRALDSSWNVNTAATDIDIWIEVDWFSFNDQDIVIPWWWIGFMEPSDLWVKIFSKWLSIKRPGTYTLRAVSVYDPAIVWETEIQVLADSSWPAVWDLMVTSPEQNEILSTNILNVVWSTSFANTPIVIFIDGSSIQEWLSDQQWNFSVTVTWIDIWDRVLEVNALDLDDQVVATSWPINFTFSEDADPLFLWVEVTPDAVVTVREQITMTISTAERVTSALIKVWEEWTMQPTTLIEPWVFEKTFTFDEPWTFPVDVRLFVWPTATDFEDIEAIVVQDEVRRIVTLENIDDPDRSRSDLSWTYDWLIEYFKVRYGTSRTNLRLSLTTTRPEWTLILAEPTQTYFAQVFPVDENWIVNGEPSQIIQIWPLQQPEPVCGNWILEPWEECDQWSVNGTPWSQCNLDCTISTCGDGIVQTWLWEECDDWVNNGQPGSTCTSECTLVQAEPEPEPIPEPIEEVSAPPVSCFTDWITLSTREINWRYYITWASVPNAREYIVYRSEDPVWSVSQMRVLARTTDTMFEYPFDPNAEADRYAWYAVEAVCAETDEQKQVWNIEQIKVGPANTIAFLLLFLIIWFGSVRVVKGIRG